jgi:uncharacterized iron-regulated membrane protein
MDTISGLLNTAFWLLGSLVAVVVVVVGAHMYWVKTGEEEGE